ncbi:hypothetical protein [Azospirillum largimobile]
MKGAGMPGEGAGPAVENGPADANLLSLPPLRTPAPVPGCAGADDGRDAEGH